MDTDERQVTVKFNDASAPRRITFEPDEDIVFGADSGKVTFTLKVETALRVVFPSNPIQWVQEGDPPGDLTPIDPPMEAKVSRMDFSVTVEITLKPETEKKEFRFYVIVQTPDAEDGRFFGSDPTIIIMRPDGEG
jgi:hypothetical protein